MSPHAEIDHSNSGSVDRPEFKLPSSPANLGSRKYRSHLRQTPKDELHDVVCVGFGPASLAIAVALHDTLEARANAPGFSSIHERPPKIAFLEKQRGFAWHAGMLLHGAKMQISFIKDMASLRNPRSEFTFLNYLHEKNRLVEFTNLNTFLPHRLEYEDYLRWCASWFEEVVAYGQEVVQVVPEKSSKSGVVDSFVVVSRNSLTNETTSIRTRHVVIAAGGRANIPAHFPQHHPKIIHSSRYAQSITSLFPDAQAEYRAAVIGSGQSAAEIFEDIQSHYPNARTNLLIKAPALKPSDDSPFVNEIFNPDRTNHIFHQEPVLRSLALASDRNTNYGVVRLELIERLYETLYTQRIKYSSEAEWPHKLLPYRTVINIEDSPVIPGGVRLHIRNDSGSYFSDCQSGVEILDVDAVFVATGYKRDTHEQLLGDAAGLMPSRSREHGKWEVRRDYSVIFEEGSVSSQAGVWLQGCNEKTHGLSDTLLSVLSVRGAEMVESIFGSIGRWDTTLVATAKL